MSRFYIGTFGVGMSVSNQDTARHRENTVLANSHQAHAYWKLYLEEMAKGDEANLRKASRYHRKSVKYAAKLPRQIDWT